MRIKKYSQEVFEAVSAWAGQNGYEIDQSRTLGSIHLTKGDHGFEFIAEDNFAYIHGEGALNGIGTTIMDMTDFETAIGGLLEKLG